MNFLKKLLGIKTDIPRDVGKQETGTGKLSEELPDAIDEAIKLHCSTGDEFAETESYDNAILEYNKAWALIPEPQSHWNASTWVLAAIADVSFLRLDYKGAGDALEFALTNCPGALGNPFLHLRYGQVLFESGEIDQAANELMRAYMGAGEEIFANEDVKYFSFLQTRADGL